MSKAVILECLVVNITGPQAHMFILMWDLVWLFAKLFLGSSSPHFIIILVSVKLWLHIYLNYLIKSRYPKKWSNPLEHQPFAVSPQKPLPSIAHVFTAFKIFNVCMWQFTLKEISHQKILPHSHLCYSHHSNYTSTPDWQHQACLCVYIYAYEMKMNDWPPCNTGNLRLSPTPALGGKCFVSGPR
jgi:hypothetical protein